jgi:hypothetical protein
LTLNHIAGITLAIIHKRARQEHPDRALCVSPHILPRKGKPWLISHKRQAAFCRVPMP